jgi:hypothetical protein
VSTLPGYRGHLLAASFLGSRVAAEAEDEVASRSRRQILAALSNLGAVGPASPPRALLELVVAPLLTALGLDRLHDFESVDDAAACTASSSLGAESRTGTVIVAVIVAPWGERLDRYWRAAVTLAGRRRASWCLISNGVAIRIVDPRRLYSRRFAEFDLSTIVESRATAAALRCVAGAAALAPMADRTAPLQALIEASEAHSAAVCRSLRQGVLAASEHVLSAILTHRRPNPASIQDSFEQSLTIVYRILFLLFAEARRLVPLWHQLYRDSYSIESLQRAAEQSDARAGFWDALRAIARLAHSGCRAGDLRVTPFNGRLFSPARTPLAERRGLDDVAARQAILALSTRPAVDGAGRDRIAYAELGVEQLGAVYETLLDYQPRVEPAAPRGSRHRSLRVTLLSGSGIRKSTGTFYTPQGIAEYVVRRTLGPLVKDVGPDQILGLRVLDPAMGSGAFLVAACRYLAACYEDALIRSGGCHPSDIDAAERTAIRRTIAERCLYGVDVNPMAVQLARLSLWLVTLAAERPLSFLDHRLLTGDSLLGAWLTLLRRPPSPRRNRPADATLPLFDAPAAAALRAALPVRFSLEATPNDTIEQVRLKERALDSLLSRGHELARWKSVADLWCAIWFPGGPPAAAYESLADVLLTGAGVLPGHSADAYLATAHKVAAGRRFFHWELEFPEVFFTADGEGAARPGFDAVIGNPPWDMMRDDARSQSGEPSIAAIVRFTRDSGIYTAQSAGHANRYQLFVERALSLTRQGGRLGLVLPSGFASDAGSTGLRRMLFAKSDADSLVAIDNRRRIFPIHRSVRFLVITATAGQPTSRIACRFGVEDLDGLPAADDHSPSAFPVRIACDALARISGPSLAIPDLRRPIDLAILEKAASLFAPLGSAEAWNARFGRELNATEDRRLFRSDRRGVPVVDGKHVAPFRVALQQVQRTITVADARRLLPGRFGRPRLAYRDVASASNRVTLIAAILPAECVSTRTVFCLRTPLAKGDQHLLCGFFNSLIVNYLARLRVSTHVTTGIVEQLPIPRREAAPRACRRIAALAVLLARRDHDDAFARLNAEVAHLYQLTAREFEHVLATFPLVESSLRRQALEHFLAGGHRDE